MINKALLFHKPILEAYMLLIYFSSPFSSDVLWAFSPAAIVGLTGGAVFRTKPIRGLEPSWVLHTVASACYPNQVALGSSLTNFAKALKTNSHGSLGWMGKKCKY